MITYKKNDSFSETFLTQQALHVCNISVKTEFSIKIETFLFSIKGSLLLAYMSI
jgi:hypothetical protein